MYIAGTWRYVATNVHLRPSKLTAFDGIYVSQDTPMYFQYVFYRDRPYSEMYLHE